MVLNMLRNFFMKKSANEGALYKQNELIGETILEVKDGFVIFATEKISLDDISAVKINKDTLYITTKDCKYKFITQNASQIFQLIHPAINPHSFLFETGRFKYSIYSVESRIFEKVELENSEIKIVEDFGKFYLCMEEEHSLIHFQQIASDLQYYMDQKNRTFVWSAYKEGLFFTFCAKFEDNIEFLQFLSSFVECTYKSVNKEGGDNKFYERMFVVENEERESDTKEREMDEKWETFEKEEPEKNTFNKDTEKTNKHLVIGQENIFVTRGASLGIFDQELHFKTQIVDAFKNPSKIISHNGNKNLIAKCETDKLDVLDLERGEIVEKWDLQQMNDFFNAERDENNGTLIGIGDYNLFRIDPRVKDKIVETKDYKMKNEFSAGIATKTGDVAVASKKGDLRLYNTIGKRAKTLINGFGDEITAIDTSKSGRLVLCTCKSYLLLHEVHENYAKPLGKNKKSPKRLQLKPQHLALINSHVNFTPAKFDQSDHFIVSSTGRYLIKWNVSDVLNGDVYNYSIKTLYDQVVDENFVINGDDIIVALPNDIKHIDSKMLKKPK
ncbi:hypothetical protein NUSPORA_01270 [Nucleospora cyclopteri]